MSQATQTFRQKLATRPHLALWCQATKDLFNTIAAFYFDVLQAHPAVLDLNDTEALTALERLTHATRNNPHPVMPLSQVTSDVPAFFRRASIHAALGSARSFSRHFSKWRAQKSKAEANKKDFHKHPPMPPRTWRQSPRLYAGMYKVRKDDAILLKLWTGSSWAWIKCQTGGRGLPEGWEAASPSLVEKAGTWWLHTPITKQFKSPGKVADQLHSSKVRICAVDLNLDGHLAVASILRADGTPLATRFLGNGAEINGRRKSLLGKVARNRSKTGICAEGEQDNLHLWNRIHGLNEQVAHLISRRIVEFARTHRATILVFEHLGNLQPLQGRYSHHANQKRMYWMKGRIFRSSRYKAWNEGIVTCRVNPKNTSQECARCHQEVARYHAGQPEEGYQTGAPLVVCLASECRHRDHADRNASIVIGQRLLARMQKPFQEKPPARPSSGRSTKVEGGPSSQDAKGKRNPFNSSSGLGRWAESGTTQRRESGMADPPRGIPRQLRLFQE
jgi:IS605 OrfB family transposase